MSKHTYMRMKILNAMNTCMTMENYSGITIRKIAETAGINHGLLHYYFKSKDEILLAYVDYIMSQYQTLFSEFQVDRDATIHSILEKILTDMLFKFEINSGMSKAVYQIRNLALFDDGIKEKMRSAEATMVNELAKVLRKQFGEKENIPEIARAFMVSGMGIASWCAVNNPKDFSAKGFIQSLLYQYEPIKQS